MRHHPGTEGIKIIMITSSDDRHAAQAAGAGVSVLLGKPYPEDQLIAYMATAHAMASEDMVAHD